MAIKLDLEKAYDRLKWTFLHNTLEEMQLPRALVEVIIKCVSTCLMSILWNGETTKTFTPTRWIRQGDPLSPYLFVACMEKQSYLIKCEVVHGKWIPFPTSRSGPKILDVLFVDDVMFFAEATTDEV